jgi:ApbE superfamily uncharacterized protein (UPF0280 family)
MSAQREPLAGGRWHFSHGPIDIVIGADGEAAAVQASHEAAWQRFQPMLQELVDELPQLRRPIAGLCRLNGVVAQRMWSACLPFSKAYITPMAAVAGSVAQELIGCYQRPGVRRAWVNNGGDIALHLAPGESTRIGLVADLAAFDAAAVRRAAAGRLQTDGQFELRAEDGVRGVATSGWRGRSFSLGIADSVTVLAATAAMADAAATVVANAVDVEWPGIERTAAILLRDDSDLGAIPVTTAVPPLPPALAREALHRGAARAHELQARGLIVAALLVCQGQAAFVSAPTLAPFLLEATTAP